MTLPRPIGLAALTVLELAPPDIVSVAHAAGYSHVGLRLIPATPHEPQRDSIGDTALVRDTIARLAGTGIRVLDVEIFRLEPDTDVGDFRAALETAQALGASNALVAGNDPDESRLGDRFAAFCDLCAGHGIVANVEPMPWTDVPTFARGARVVAQSRRANAAVLIDALHFDRGGNRLEEIAAVPREHLRYVQLCDAPAQRPARVDGLIHEARSARSLPGAGALDLRGLLAALPSDLPISLEIPDAERARSVPAAERASEALQATLRLLGALQEAKRRDPA